MFPTRRIELGLNHRDKLAGADTDINIKGGAGHNYFISQMRGGDRLSQSSLILTSTVRTSANGSDGLVVRLSIHVILSKRWVPPVPSCMMDAALYSDVSGVRQPNIK